MKDLGLKLHRIDLPSIHGTSYIFTITNCEKKLNLLDNVKMMKEYESECGLYTKQGMLNYRRKCLDYRLRVEKFMLECSDDVVMIGYGSTAKSNTLLNSLHVSINMEFIIDDNPLKQKRVTPGLNIPVVSQKIGLSRSLDVVIEKGKKELWIIVFAWNFYEEIYQKLEDYYKKVNNGYKIKCINISTLETKCLR